MSKQRATALLARFGHDTVCSQALEPGLSYWFADEDACVAYRDLGDAWVGAGGPICAFERRDQVIAAFLRAAGEAGKRPRFFATEYASEHCKSIPIGEQPEWDPGSWKATLAAKKSLREQLRRARAKGVVVRLLGAEEISDATHPTRLEVSAMVHDWQINRAMAPMSFLVSLDLFGNAELKEYFVAEREGIVQAILVAAPIPQRDGWFFEDVLRAHDAPNGTVELLFDHAMQTAHARGIKVVSYGLAPLSGEVSSWLARVRNHTRWLYDFAGLRAFKSKLAPQTWRPVYLSIPPREKGLRATIDSLTAFAGGSWLRFGMRTLLHALPTMTWTLALLLLPWCFLLGVAPIPQWFPSEEIQAAWIAFDLVLLILLIRLALDWQRSRALQLATLALADAVLGILQLALHTRHQLHDFASWTIALGSITIPMVVSLLLFFGATRRDSLYLQVPHA